MTEHTREAHEALRSIVRSLTNYPDEVDLCVVEVNGGAYWRMTVHADDQKKVVGIEGSHIKALTYILAEMGRQNGGWVYKLKLDEPINGQRRYSTPKPTVKSYNPAKAHELLARVVSLVTAGRVHVELDEDAGEDFAYTFTLVPRTSPDHHALTDARECTHRQTVIGALGTLWRAYAQRDGVRFTLQIRPSLFHVEH